MVSQIMIGQISILMAAVFALSVSFIPVRSVRIRSDSKASSSSSGFHTPEHVSDLDSSTASRTPHDIPYFNDEVSSFSRLSTAVNLDKVAHFSRATPPRQVMSPRSPSSPSSLPPLLPVSRICVRPSDVSLVTEADSLGTGGSSRETSTMSHPLSVGWRRHQTMPARNQAVDHSFDEQSNCIDRNSFLDPKKRVQFASRRISKRDFMSESDSSHVKSGNTYCNSYNDFKEIDAFHAAQKGQYGDNHHDNRNHNLITVRVFSRDDLSKELHRVDVPSFYTVFDLKLALQPLVAALEGYVLIKSSGRSRKFRIHSKREIVSRAHDDDESPLSPVSPVSPVSARTQSEQIFGATLSEPNMDAGTGDSVRVPRFNFALRRNVPLIQKKKKGSLTSFMRKSSEDNLIISSLVSLEELHKSIQDTDKMHTPQKVTFRWFSGAESGLRTPPTADYDNDSIDHFGERPSNCADSLSVAASSRDGTWSSFDPVSTGPASPTSSSRGKWSRQASRASSRKTTIDPQIKIAEPSTAQSHFNSASGQMFHPNDHMDLRCQDSETLFSRVERKDTHISGRSGFSGTKSSGTSSTDVSDTLAHKLPSGTNENSKHFWLRQPSTIMSRVASTFRGIVGRKRKNSDADIPYAATNSIMPQSEESGYKSSESVDPYEPESLTNGFDNSFISRLEKLSLTHGEYSARSNVNEISSSNWTVPGHVNSTTAEDNRVNSYEKISAKIVGVLLPVKENRVATDDDKCDLLNIPDDISNRSVCPDVQTPASKTENAVSAQHSQRSCQRKNSAEREDGEITNPCSLPEREDAESTTAAINPSPQYPVINLVILPIDTDICMPFGDTSRANRLLKRALTHTASPAEIVARTAHRGVEVLRGKGWSSTRTEAQTSESSKSDDHTDSDTSSLWSGEPRSPGLVSNSSFRSDKSQTSFTSSVIKRVGLRQRGQSMSNPRITGSTPVPAPKDRESDENSFCSEDSRSTAGMSIQSSCSAQTLPNPCTGDGIRESAKDLKLLRELYDLLQKITICSVKNLEHFLQEAKNLRLDRPLPKSPVSAQRADSLGTPTYEGARDMETREFERLAIHRILSSMPSKSSAMNNLNHASGKLKVPWNPVTGNAVTVDALRKAVTQELTLSIQDTDEKIPGSLLMKLDRLAVFQRTELAPVPFFVARIIFDFLTAVGYRKHFLQGEGLGSPFRRSVSGPDTSTSSIPPWMSSFQQYYLPILELLLDAGATNGPITGANLEKTLLLLQILSSNWEEGNRKSRSSANNARMRIQKVDEVIYAPSSDRHFVHYEILRLLLKYKMPPDTKLLSNTGSSSRTLLQDAVLRHDAKAVELLLRFGADPLARGSGGITAIHECVSWYQSNIEEARYILGLLLTTPNAALLFSNRDEATNSDTTLAPSEFIHTVTSYAQAKYSNEWGNRMLQEILSLVPDSDFA